MSKLLAVMIAGLFAAGAYAQNPAGVSSEQQPVTNSKAQSREDTMTASLEQGRGTTSRQCGLCLRLLHCRNTNIACHDRHLRRSEELRQRPSQTP